MFRITEVVKYLLIANVIVFLVGPDGINLIDTSPLALYYPGSENFRPWQIVTHFFMHGGFTHLFFNMFGLVMFGSAIEQRWGPKRFLMLYIVCALGAALCHTLYNWYVISGMQDAVVLFMENPSYDRFLIYFKDFGPRYMQSAEQFLDLADAIDAGKAEAVAQAGEFMGQLQTLVAGTPVVGASGAIYGVLVAFGLLYPNTELMLIFLPIPIKAKYFIPLLLIGDLFLGFSNYSWDNIAHFAHLGGALFGFLLFLYWNRQDTRWDRSRY